jgi:hypothetical protein
VQEDCFAALAMTDIKLHTMFMILLESLMPADIQMKGCATPLAKHKANDGAGDTMIL